LTLQKPAFSSIIQRSKEGGEMKKEEFVATRLPETLVSDIKKIESGASRPLSRAEKATLQGCNRLGEGVHKKGYTNSRRKI
jgi:hypothetical protein